MTDDERAEVVALLDRYRGLVLSEWSAEPDRTHDPEYWAVKDRLGRETRAD
jgi:hypothetical protein